MRADLAAALTKATGHVDQVMREALPDGLGPVAQAMRYAVEGGKCLRAFLVFESARVNGVAEHLAIPAAAAIECIHGYSLVHDDLPCMDDDDLRRGRPTVHKAWDEATAVLAGDALHTMAFELIGGRDPAGTDGLSDRTLLALSTSLARAAGIHGMVGGQAADMAAERAVAPLSLEDIIGLQRRKTGALIEWAATCGARMADAAQAEWQALDRYGQNLGLAFQIWDDVLDVEGDAETVGKAVGKDAGRGKATFVSHLGLDGAKRRAENLVTEACDALSVYADRAECLREAARFVISRRN